MVKSDIAKDEFLNQHQQFSLRETVSYPNGGFSYFYDDGTDMVIIDEGICDHGQDEPVFSYMLITDKQNSYMHRFNRLFRFLGYKKELVDKYLEADEIVVPVDYKITVADRGEQADVSPLELHFERNFSNVYGLNALKYLSREYGICDENGKNYFLDYLVRTTDQKYAIEENGVSYHHPQIIGEEKYRNQLRKQNTCALWGIKLYRFSTEDCAFDSRIEDDIKQYMGDSSSHFVDDGLKIDRKVELYEHQTISLNEIQNRRDSGIKAFLVVLPTASGKSKILEEDLREFAKDKPDFKGLILVPGKNTLADWKERIRTSIPELLDKIDVCTYAYMARHYTEKSSGYYNYLAVDEAHHAVAPILKRVIQYFETDFTIGLTATDQRPDKKKLETVFGTYTSSLSLKDAMEKGIVAKANVYRIETNIDLSKVRFNGKDYVNADLEKSIRVTSRNDLIVNVLKDYFVDGDAGKRQGVIFCVNVSHSNEMAKLLNDSGISALSYTGQSRNPEEIMRKFKDKEVRFLCSCNMISEGWDYPELGILVMARPTLSKVLYLQQIGRGLRKTAQKNNVIVIDVVDEYGAMVKACNMHTIFANPYYVPFGDITKTDYKNGDMITIDGFEERIEKITEVDIDSFEDKYGNYLSQEQVAREYFVSTGTVTSWIKKGKIQPSVEYKFGSKSMYLFSPEAVETYRQELDIREHNDETIKEDFFEFLEERDYSLSYKMPFMLGFLKHLNSIGDARIEDILEDYIAFYRSRLERGLQVDRKSCPYDEKMLKDKSAVKRNMLTNPFEKFERKRFLYYSKDLSIISMNHALFEKLTKEDFEKIENQLSEDLKNYYSDMGGL
ncbi:DEAD/DEAH box helicase [Oribacterium sp. P6A1]|uniref:DEAD/DEAH box helicase n=1 Tax=Oribacterium sp. P6A1 TaxID=1410612 RepID=UPI000559E1D9|nr:DEAD/DEAH box helicase family protein [Oribacterium sp. P6A1]